MSQVNSSNNTQKEDIGYINQSYTESRESVDIEVGSYFQKLKRRWKPALAIFLLTVGSTYAATRLLQKKYIAEGKLLFKPNTTADLTGVGEGQRLDTFLNNQTPLVTQQQVISSSPVLQQTIDELQLKDKDGQTLTPEEMEKKLKVKIVGGSDVISITYEDLDPNVSSEVVNTLMNVYIQQQILSRRDDTASADSFINNQIPEIEGKLKKYESILQEFREKNSVVDLDEEKRIIVGEIGTLNRQIAAVGSKLQGTRAQTASLQRELGFNLNQAISINQLGNSPITQSYLNELATTEKELAQERKRFNDSHPSIQGLLDKRRDLRSNLQGKISQTVGSGVRVSDGLLTSDGLKENPLERFISLKIDELSLQKQLSAVSQYQQSYLQRAKQLPRLEKREQEMIRQVETARKTYENLLSTQQELQLLQNQQTGNAEIIEPAIPPKKGNSGTLAFMVLGTLLGLLLSNMTAVLLEMQDRTLKTIPEIKKKLPHKVLGIIPLSQSTQRDSGVIVQREPDSYASEIYRMIQANLKFMTSQRPPKVILVTSSLPGEGKSTVTANLAAAISQLGRRVLVVDGDLRKASQHQLWGISNRKGIKDVVTDKVALEEVTSQPMAKLDVLTSGNTPSNPLAILDSVEMSELLAKARREYDLVLVDAPPLPVTADVLTLSKLVDGIVLVSRPGVVEHESADLAQETLTATRQKVLGMVINGVGAKEFDRYSYSAKYGSSYFSKSKDNNNGTSKAITA